MKKNNSLKIILASSVAVSVLLIDPLNSKALTVQNLNNEDIGVAVSAHGSGGNGSKYIIKNIKMEEWDRTADRGNLISYNNKYYYSDSNENLIVKDNKMYRKTKDNTLLVAKYANQNRYENPQSIGTYLEKYNLTWDKVDLKQEEGVVKVKSLINDYDISLSRWKNGTGSFFNVSKNKSEKWSREKNESNILTISTPSEDYQYYVETGETVTILDITKGEVFVSGILVTPINKGSYDNNVELKSPENLHATSVTNNSISLEWDPVSYIDGIKSYMVIRDGLKISETKVPYFKDTNLESSKEYTYFIKAITKNDLISDNSNVIQEKTK